MEHDPRRLTERVPAIISVSYESAGAMRTDYAQNISKGGLFVVTDEPFKVGQHLDLKLQCPGLRDPATVPGEVRWVGERGSPPQRGIGVRFDLKDPVQRVRIESMLNAVFEPIDPPVEGERLNILIVDPNQHASRMFSEGITKMAGRVFDVANYFTVLEAEDGAKAMGHLAASEFSLVICDLNTPEVDGVEVIRRIRTAVSQSLPIFAMSRPFPGAKSEAIGAGADLFMEKPIQLRALFNTIRMMLRLAADEERGADES